MEQRSIARVLFRAFIKLLCLHRRRPTRVRSVGFSAALTGGSTIRKFSISELRSATEHFCPKAVVDQESLNVTVYKGVLPSGEPVKIRREIVRNEGCPRQACQDRAVQDVLHYHPNIVKLVGYCSKKKQQFLVYEDVANASTLSDHLYDRHIPRLSWLKRVEIAFGVANGIAHVHDSGREPGVHGNIKSITIILDDKLVPKVSEVAHSNFKEWSNETEGTPESAGYLPPEYYSTRTLTDKADVYAFGVVLMELLTGKVSFDKQRHYNNEKALLVDLMHSTVTKGGWEKAKWKLDPAISQQDRTRSLELEFLLNLSLFCTESDLEKRPRMGTVVNVVESLLQRIQACEIQTSNSDPPQ